MWPQVQVLFIMCLMVVSTLSKEWTKTANCTSGTVVIQHIHAYKDTGNPDCGGITPGIDDIREQCLCNPTCQFTIYTGACTGVNVTFACDPDSCFTTTHSSASSSLPTSAVSPTLTSTSSTTLNGGTSTPDDADTTTTTLENTSISTEHEPVYAAPQSSNVGVIAGVSVAVVVVLGVVGVIAVCLVVRRRRLKLVEKSQVDVTSNKGLGTDNRANTGPDSCHSQAIVQDNSYMVLDENVYNEPADGLEPGPSQSETLTEDDEYNRINFHRKEFSVDPGYGTLDSNKLSPPDQLYSHTAPQTAAQDNTYSHVPRYNTADDYTLPRNHGNSSSPAGQDSVYNHLESHGQHRVQRGMEQDDNYSHLGKSRGNPQKQLVPGNLPIYGCANRRKPHNYVEPVDSLGIYELAKPNPRGDNSPEPLDTAYDFATPFQSGSAVNQGAPVNYEFAQPLP